MINSKQIALIKKDIRAVTTNKRLFSVLLIVPLVMTVFIPSIFIIIAGVVPLDSNDFQSLIATFNLEDMLDGDLREMLIKIVLNELLPLFFMMIPVMSASIMAASSFIGEKEKRTLETLLYCPLSLRQIFDAKIIASFLISQLVSLISVAAMFLVVQLEVFIILGVLIPVEISWLILLLLVSPALALTTITIIVRGSAKAKSVEESQQRSVFMVIPIVLLIVMQASGLQILSVWLLFALGVICALVGFVLLKRASANFHYESLLL
ncbi:MAG: ABC transporter permease subunit [Lachnospiraceae bacterium]|nr:ABC transporter permease subunit [Lachnospiraceae bacterium]